MIPDGFLICDIPPGGYIVVRSPMTVSEILRLKRLWQDMDMGLRGLPPVQPGLGERQWPDAEFCAA